MAVIGRLPNAAVVDADVKDVGLPRNPRGADSPSRAERPDAAPAQRLIEILVVLLSGGPGQFRRRRCQHRKQNNDKQRRTNKDHRVLLENSDLKLVLLLSKFCRFYTEYQPKSSRTCP